MSKSPIRCGAYVVLGGIVLIIGLGVSTLWTNTGKETFTATISSATEKTSNGETTYLVNAKYGTTIEPLEVKNNLALGRFDQSTIYAQLKDVSQGKQCVSLDVYGVRIPGVTFRGISNHRIVPCSNINQQSKV